MLESLVRSARKSLSNLKLPAEARRLRNADHEGVPAPDPGPDVVEPLLLDWLRAAQDYSSSRDGGAARDYSLINGWASSYPETSGYIVPTLIEAGKRLGDEDLLRRARRMLDWLIGIQFPEGGFQGGTIGASPVVPVTFNTGQILMGLAAGAREWGAPYDERMHRAARWLVETVDEDGCWRRFPTPFAAFGEKVYETHVSWGLIEAARASEDSHAAALYAETARRNCLWALTHQRPNGWFDKCCLEQPEAPLTHTIGYAIRGLLEVHAYTRHASLLSAAQLTGRAIAKQVRPDGYLAGRLASDWRPAVEWVCLTGSAQIGHALLLLYVETGEEDLRDAGRRLLAYVRRTVPLVGQIGVRGGVKGSHPVDGGYGTYEFLNWAAKFLVDGCSYERTLLRDV